MWVKRVLHTRFSRYQNLYILYQTLEQNSCELGVLNKVLLGIMRFSLKDTPTDTTKEQQSIQHPADDSFPT